ncbi:type II secretion system protein J [Ningiella sp. W23]|uniref:PulJ/GspJ family protein n=1 Tax=Ningiella sp. W23 TaxID=3023715 RepID=UPI003758275F
MSHFKLYPNLHNRSHGFTLLEMMVVLVIVSLITVLMMQGFSFVVGLQDRIRNQLVKTQDTELREQWFRLVTRSFQRGRQSDNANFSADAFEMSGLVLQPLNRGTGLPTKVRWRIEQEGDYSILYYDEAEDEPVVIFEWLNAEVEFRYLNSSGELQDEWPVEEEEQDIFAELPSPPLPKGIMLIDTSEETDFFWYVSISSNTLPDLDFTP